MGQISNYTIKVIFIQLSSILFSCVLAYSVLSKISHLSIKIPCYI